MYLLLARHLPRVGSADPPSPHLAQEVGSESGVAAVNRSAIVPIVVCPRCSGMMLHPYRSVLDCNSGSASRNVDCCRVCCGPLVLPDLHKSPDGMVQISARHAPFIVANCAEVAEAVLRRDAEAAERAMKKDPSMVALWQAAMRKPEFQVTLVGLAVNIVVLVLKSCGPSAVPPETQGSVSRADPKAAPLSADEQERAALRRAIVELRATLEVVKSAQDQATCMSEDLLIEKIGEYNRLLREVLEREANCNVIIIGPGVGVWNRLHVD